jgi:oligosaccharide repeat unit polymerase
MDVQMITYLTMGLFLLALVLFFFKNDEVLLLLVIFFYSTGINRYNNVISGKEKWVVVAYSKNIFSLNNDLGIQALNYYFWGVFTFTVFYFAIKINYNKPLKAKDNKSILIAFLEKNKTLILLSFAAIAFVNFYSKRGFSEAYLSGSASIAFGNSYSIMIGFAFGGFLVLVYLIYSNLEFKKAGASKLFFLAIFIYAASMTYSSSGRFQFLSWGVAVGIMMVKDSPPILKLRTYLIGGFLLAIAFGLAGAMRGKDSGSFSWSDRINMAIERNASGEDQTMLDGFMMVLQVYPQHLNYHFGSEHLEVLYRPIPRSIWPGKPLGGYANKLGLNDNMGGGSVGISQSLFGSFYGEGGFLGIIIFSILYAWVLHLIFRYGDRYNSDVRWVIKGITISSLIPLLRGGDLPGVYAFIGMTFWPTVVFIYRYNKHVVTTKQELFRQYMREKQLEEAAIAINAKNENAKAQAH